MGGDCCGGSAAADKAADAAAHVKEQLKDLYVADAHPANGSPAAANGAAPPKAHAKSDADNVKEKLPYFKQRIDLFEQYQKRELQKVEDAKAANVPLKGELPLHSPLHAGSLVCRFLRRGSRHSRCAPAQMQQLCTPPR